MLLPALYVTAGVTGGGGVVGAGVGGGGAAGGGGEAGGGGGITSVLEIVKSGQVPSTLIPVPALIFGPFELPVPP